MRKLRSLRKRNHLWLSQNGKCQECNQNLPLNWHADHKIPFVICGTTELHNMQALCPSCNLKKGKKMMPNPRSAAYYEGANFCKVSNISKARIGQRGAINCIIDRCRQGYSTSAVVNPTRYGKSHVIRCSAIELKEQQLVCGSILTTPGKILRDQLIETSKIEDMIKHLSIQPTKVVTCDVVIEGKIELLNEQFKRDNYFISMTTPMLTSIISDILPLIKRKIQIAGKPMAIFIDETHLSSTDNVSGDAIQQLLNIGCYVVLVTATHYRSDGKRIPGFNWTILDSTTKERKKPSSIAHPNPDKINMDVYNHTQEEIILKADYEYSFQQAWAEGNVLCRINRIPIDVHVTITKPNGETIHKRIRDFTTDETREYLHQICRDPKVIAKATSLLVENLEIRRKTNPTTQAIVFVGNDKTSDKEANGHAKQVEKSLLSTNAELKIGIATMSSLDDPDGVIKLYKENKYDVLIVKQMASIGLDVSPCKVLVDLSSVRTKNACIQKWTRAATIWGDVNTCDFITPDDVVGANIFDELVASVGGSVMKTSQTTFLRLEEADRQDAKDKDSMQVDKVVGGRIYDTDSRFIEDDIHQMYVLPVLEIFPSIGNNNTRPQIGEMMQALHKAGLYTPPSKDATIHPQAAQPNTTTQLVVNESELCREIRTDINILVNRIVKLRTNNSQDQDLLNETYAKVHTEIKKSAGYSYNMELKNIRDDKKLIIIKEAAKKIIDRMCNPN